MQSWLTWDSYVDQVDLKLKKPTCVCILNARIKGVYCHACLKMTFWATEYVRNVFEREFHDFYFQLVDFQVVVGRPGSYNW